MLLLFLVFGVLSENRNAAQGYKVDSRASVDSCDDINSCRRMFDIILGCLSTIFACTWVSVHPNLPPPGQSWLALLLRRLRMMLVAIIAPELIVGFAARQLFVARRFSKDYDVPLSHGFFFSMGGFVSRIGHPIVTKKQIQHPLFGPQYLAAIRQIKTEDIMDKGKGDALSKGVALAQGVWFTAQCLARVSQRLPMTELEVVTLAFAVMNIFTRLLWWGKPLDVQQPIPVGPTEQPHEAIPPPHRVNLLDRFAGLCAGYYPEYDPATDARGALFIVECFVGTIFGAIHCAAWNAHFPSADEMWMWRACSLLVAVIPVTLAASYMIAHCLPVPVAIKKTKAFTLISLATLLLGIPTYIIARLFLVILPFTALRALPPGAFMDVDWRVYIPHL
ncbi:hypothetical protein FB451DRAFT_1566418 [Mycena latifolia]|nr:hypothetical protein FB451DRAFT_1566418 [Mycena latifolia]